MRGQAAENTDKAVSRQDIRPSEFPGIEEHPRNVFQGARKMRNPMLTDGETKRPVDTWLITCCQAYYVQDEERC